MGTKEKEMRDRNMEIKRQMKEAKKIAEADLGLVELEKEQDAANVVRDLMRFQNSILDGRGPTATAAETEDRRGVPDKDTLRGEVLLGKLELDTKKIAALARNPRFEVYMGYTADDIEAMLEVARNQGLNVVLLDTPEEWGYSFLLVETKKFHLSGDGWDRPFDIRLNPLEPLELGKSKEEEDSEFTISAWDLFPDALSIEDFGYWNKIPEIQWPTEIRLQVSLISE